MRRKVKHVLVPHQLNSASQDAKINKAIRKMTKRGWVFSGTQHTYGGIRVEFVVPSRATKGVMPMR